MLFIVEERQGVSNATLVWEEGVGIHRGRGQMSTICKKGAIFFFYGSASTLLSPFGPSFEVAGEKNAGYFPTDEHPQKW